MNIQRNRPQSIYFLALASGDPQTGDAANMTASVFKDGVRAVATNAVVEEDATHAPGVYRLDLTAAETNARAVLAWVVSSTNSVDVTPVAVGGSTMDEGAPMLGPFTATGTPSKVSVTCEVSADQADENYFPQSVNAASGMFIWMQSGAQRGVVRAVASSTITGTTLTLTFDEMNAAMAAGDAFMVGGLS